jgi:amino acid adenylation domain-containing protein
VGTPIANRTRAETEDLIGFFVNTLVLRGRLSSGITFRELLEQTREVTLGAYAHQELPFERLVEELQPERSLSHTPLFQVMFTLQNTPLPSAQLGGLRMSAEGESTEQAAKFELSLAMMEGEAGLAGAFDYRAELFEAETVKRMVRHFEQVLRAAVADVEQKVSDIELLSKGEREQILVRWNSTRREGGEWKGIAELFEEQVKRTPDALAIVFREQQLSYRELNQRANQLAHYLRELGVGPEQIVGILMDRSVEMVTAVLAVLKAGGAYLPLDSEYPQERLSFMLSDAGVGLLLTREQLPRTEIKVIAVNQSEEIKRQSVENPAKEVSGENLAYVIYTSGSTGKPKGVQIRHRGVSNVIAASIERLGVGAGSRVLQAASLSFDASVLEIFTALLSGASLFLVDVETLMSNSRLGQLMRDQAITFIASPPSRLDTITESNFPNLRTIIVGGESCSADTVARWSGGRRFFNAYAPTETTIYSTLFECSEITSQPPPVGRPIANTEVYLLDGRLHPVPLGARGELYIGGAGIARGYLNRPELTAERFIPNPFGSEPGARLYRTGDLARYLPDGNIEFVGRTDQQVKLRGFRIELGEIEAALGQHPAVRETVVTLREDRPRDKRLIAYLVMKPTADGETFPTASEWRGYLKEKLPEYMIPSLFVRLEELPRTATGKIDRRALPAPELSGTDAGGTYVEPRTAVEKMLSELWSEVLGVERVGVRDNFFELGGHSLLATQLISRVREDFHVDVELRTLFEFPTVEGLAEIVTRKRVEQEDPQEIAHLLDALEQMSEEEAGRL